jgi:hypothetical protein
MKKQVRPLFSKAKSLSRTIMVHRTANLSNALSEATAIKESTSAEVDARTEPTKKKTSRTGAWMTLGRHPHPQYTRLPGLPNFFPKTD